MQTPKLPQLVGKQSLVLFMCMFMCLVCSMAVMNTQVPSSTLGGLYSHVDHGCIDHIGLRRQKSENLQDKSGMESPGSRLS